MKKKFRLLGIGSSQKRRGLLFSLGLVFLAQVNAADFLGTELVTSKEIEPELNRLELLTFKGDASIGFRHDSNVAQTPDGQPLVSQESGSLIEGSLNLNIGFQEKRGIQGLSFVLGAGKTDYIETKFTNRQSENLSFTINHLKKLGKASKRMTSTKKLVIRQDYLDATSRRELGFRTFTLGELNLFKPIKKKWGYQAIVPVFGLDFEFRDYVNSLSLDASGEEKDTYTPQLLLLGVGIKNHKGLAHKTTAMVLLRDSYSSSEEQEYLSSRISLNHAIKKKKHEGTLGLAYARRDQDDYLGGKREDVKWEFSLAGSTTFDKKRWTLKAEVKYEDQESNIAQFVYDNTSFSLSLKRVW